MFPPTHRRRHGREPWAVSPDCAKPPLSNQNLYGRVLRDLLRQERPDISVSDYAIRTSAGSEQTRLRPAAFAAYNA